MRRAILFTAFAYFVSAQGCGDILGKHCSKYKPLCNEKSYKHYLSVNCAFTCKYCGKSSKSQKSIPKQSNGNQPAPSVIPGRDFMPWCGSILPRHTRIVGGTNAKPGSSPWQVIVDKKRHTHGRYCGGVIISDEWIITAAHCVFNETDITKFSIRVGVHDLNFITGWQQNFQVREIYVHPYYDDHMVDYDLALVRLTRKVRFNGRVRPACLPDATVNFDEGTLCKITGWGKIKDFKTAPAILQQARVPLIRHSKCQKTFQNLYGYNVTNRMLCTGHQNGTIGPCDGDSGGPLVCMRKSKITGEEVWYAWGTISWGEGCAVKGIYSVYANVKELRRWIIGTVNSKSRKVVIS